MDEGKVRVAINEVEILARKVDLEQQLNAAQSMVAALSGALQDCDWWLAKLAGKEEEILKEIRETEAIKVANALEAAAKKKKKKKK